MGTDERAVVDPQTERQGLQGLRVVAEKATDLIKARPSRPPAGIKVRGLMHNFGKNVVYEPRHRYTPRTEEEVLAILARHRGGQIRVQGSGHSWSGIVEATDVLVSLAYFSGVTVEEGPVGHVARVGAGATIETILAELRKTTFSLPTLGAITRQTIAGAAATATHGTGSASLSSFVRTVRVACYDAGGNPVIRTIRGGDELLAARVSLGCLGAILELTLELVPRFWMHECMKVHDSLESVLAAEAEWPQQQFLVFPYGWRWYAYHRRRVPEPNARALRRLRWFRAYDVLVVEWGLHSLVKAVLGAARLFGTRAVTGFWKQTLPSLMRSVPVSGSSETILTLHTRHHHTYRHVEMELFVPKEHLPAAVALLQEAIPFFAGLNAGVSATLGAELARAGLLDEYHALQGQYVHHYLIFFRRVLGEETYLAMNEGGERYSMSLFTFEPERRRGTYYAVCGFLARAFARLYSARPHWGKYNPLTSAEIAPLYPGLERFREIRMAQDPNGVFQNAYTKVVLGGKSPSNE
jgi:FAD/FMN-containing dehydrogenase